MAELTKISAVPSIFTEAVYLIEGKPFRFTGREYLRTLYDTDIRSGLLKTGRQVEKSTTVGVKIANGVLLKPFSRGLFVAPRTEQVKTFSKERLAKLFRYSTQNIVRSYYMSSELTDQVFMKEFTNGATVWLRHCFDEGDNIRGLSIDDLYIDEVQDVLVDAIPVIQETQFASERSTTWFTGTPKTFSNTIEFLWQNSTKAEWIIKCDHCNTYQVLGIKNITPKFLQCRKCGRELTRENISNGFWKEAQPEKPLKGFHIPQMLSPKAKMSSEDGKGIYQKLQTYPAAKFYNEVLGLSYENADKMITDVMLDDIMNNDEGFHEYLPKKFSLNKVFMGIDWGTGETSYTVVTIFTYNEDGKFQMLYCKVYKEGEELEIDKQVNHIALLMDKYKVDLCVSDWGFGYVQNQRLRNMFGKRMAICYYTHNQKEKIVYDIGKDVYRVRRTDVISDYITEMLQKRTSLWPGSTSSREYLQFMRAHHLCEQAEYRPSQSGKSEEMIFTHPVNAPDDGLHSCVYSYLASLIHTGGAMMVKNVGPHNAKISDVKFFGAYSRN